MKLREDSLRSFVCDPAEVGAQNSHKNSRGFTLIETIVAGFVLTITSLSLSASLATSSNVSESVRREMEARSAMRAVLAEMRSVPFSEMKATYENASFDVAHLRAPKGEAKPGRITIEDGPAGTQDLLRIRLRVRWMDGSTEREIETVHLVTRIYG